MPLSPLNPNVAAETDRWRAYRNGSRSSSAAFMNESADDERVAAAIFALLGKLSASQGKAERPVDRPLRCGDGCVGYVCAACETHAPKMRYFALNALALAFSCA